MRDRIHAGAKRLISDLGRLTKTLRGGYSRALGTSQAVRAKMRGELPRITKALDMSGEAVFIDARGNRFLIKREPVAR